MDSSFNIKDRVLKFSGVVIDIIMEETVSQMFFSGPGGGGGTWVWFGYHVPHHLGELWRWEDSKAYIPPERKIPGVGGWR